MKEQKIREAQEVANRPKINEDIPEHIKENPRNKRYHEVIPPKEVPAKGHYLDRRSGTGRNDRPRKEGGGRGNVGNLDDELKRDIYERDAPRNDPAAEEPAAEEEKPKQPEEPEKLTLEEYYRQKGVEVGGSQPREPVKKGEINAEWIKKENLTVLETKEDKRAREQAHLSRRDLKNQVGRNDENAELLGFGSKPQQQQRREEEPRENRDQRGGRGDRGGRDGRDNRDGKDTRKAPRAQNKVNLNEEDFPSL